MIQKFSNDCIDYLRDESRQSGHADTIAFPHSTDAVVNLITKTAATDTPVTIQGGRTGIVAGSVPQGGCILNLSKMGAITGMRYDEKHFYISVQPGVILSELRDALASKNLPVDLWSSSDAAVYQIFKKSPEQFFPPDPTETSATIGGMVACNASGARSFLYGSIRKYVSALTVVLADGSTCIVRRNTHKAVHRHFTLAINATKTIAGELPDYQMPPVKNAAGYYSNDNMDLIDLFIGAEGTLGVITGIEVQLLEKPAVTQAMTAFFPTEEQAIAYVEQVRCITSPTKAASIAALEYFDYCALNLLRTAKQDGGVFARLPNMPDSYHTAIYTEFHGTDISSVNQLIMHGVALVIDCGGTEEAIWPAETHKELEHLSFFRHAVPESVNRVIDKRRTTDPSIFKLSTDMAVPDAYLREVVSLYRTGLAQSGLEAVLFGHIGNNHIHVNILPRNNSDYDAGKALYAAWARRIIAWGGTISAEHGVGKLKTNLLKEMYGDNGIAAMRDLKRIFDPAMRLNPGNLF